MDVVRSNHLMHPEQQNLGIYMYSQTRSWATKLPRGLDV